MIATVGRKCVCLMGAWQMGWRIVTIASCGLMCAATAALPSASLADGPADNQAESVRAIPPPGIELNRQIADDLRSTALALERLLSAQLPGDLRGEPNSLSQRAHDLCAVLPRAVLMTLDTHMFYSDAEVEGARKLLELGRERLLLLKTNASELELLGLSESAASQPLPQPTPLVGGFRSHIDDSIQPYGLVLPQGWTADAAKPWRLDVWLHGRNENVSESSFLNQRLNGVGEIAPENTIVLHPFGRYSNAFKFAGESDVLEAIAHVKQLFAIDGSRITIRGFSMGGAGAWQLAVHYPGLWAAANPGAGFSETTEFLRVFQQEETHPTPYQQALLHWYDCPDWTNNLRQVPTVAYSGEKDRQKQAADVMAAAFESRGMQLTHIIGPDTEHRIHAQSKIEIEEFLSDALQQGKPAVPREIDLTTYTLRYHQLGWLSIEGLEQHWAESRVRGEWLSDERAIELTTSGVTRLALQFPQHESAPTRPLQELRIDGQVLSLTGTWSTPQQRLELVRTEAGQWSPIGADRPIDSATLRKSPGLQGPIDDAFMERFIIVPPTAGEQASPVERWAESECQRAKFEWKRHFRGDARVFDPAGTESLGKDQHLVLFGTPKTNRLLAEIVKKLPIVWSESGLIVNGKKYSADEHTPVMIYPNPFSPSHYVVINSSFTFREYAYLNNARQVPMLPDWAVVDVSSGANSQLPGDVLDAGFFDEQWLFPVGSTTP